MGERPLAFGRLEALPLEEKQLNHVLEGREQKKSSPSWDAGAPLHCQDVLEELGVHRYKGLVEDGDFLLTSHLGKLDSIAGVAGQGADKEDDAHLEPGGTVDFAKAVLASRSSDTTPSDKKTFPTSWSPGYVRGSSSDEGSMSEARTGAESAEMASDGESLATSVTSSPQRSRAESWRVKVEVLGKVALMHKKIKDRKEREAWLKKQRADALVKRITSEELPQEIREREVFTTWVSPATRTVMAGANDRFALRKPSAEAFHLKMETKPFTMRSLSMPALQTLHPSRSDDAQRSPKEGRSTAPDAYSVTGNSVRTGASGRTGGRRGLDSSEGLGSSLPRLASASGGPRSSHTIGNGEAIAWSRHSDSKDR